MIFVWTIVLFLAVRLDFNMMILSRLKHTICRQMEGLSIMEKIEIQKHRVCAGERWLERERERFRGREWRNNRTTAWHRDGG